jgi:hypothetical protein
MSRSTESGDRAKVVERRTIAAMLRAISAEMSDRHFRRRLLEVAREFDGDAGQREPKRRWIAGALHAHLPFGLVNILLFT